uniref:Uncharacterized protein n=1 Tax=Plectus sambesii TaxID=2011161 RepID=A0A914VSU9_9BILA
MQLEERVCHVFPFQRFQQRNVYGLD